MVYILLAAGECPCEAKHSEGCVACVEIFVGFHGGLRRECPR
jgi:hypothetical protein